MNINSFMPAEVISGKNCFNDNYDKLASLGKKCMIVTGGSSAEKCGAINDVKAALRKLSINYTVFNGITENPYTADCFRAGEEAREFGADFIIGIGGGSPLDASKAIAIYASNPELKHDDIYLRKYSCKPLPLVLIGTTSGTGSEVTGVSVLTNSNTGMKKSISGHDCYSQISYCDYTYTKTMPYSVTVSTALDAFAHGSESYFSEAANELSEIYALRSMKIVWEGLKYFYETKSLPDEELREKMYIGSLFGGLAINITGTCFPHTVGYILTEDYNIPHGRACAAFTPEYLKIAAENCPEKSDSLFKLLNADLDKITEVVTALADIKIKMTSDEIKNYGKRWTSGIKNFSRTPGNFTGETAEKILTKYIK